MSDWSRQQSGASSEGCVKIIPTNETAAGRAACGQSLKDLVQTATMQKWSRWEGVIPEALLWHLEAAGGAETHLAQEAGADAGGVPPPRQLLHGFLAALAGCQHRRRPAGERGPARARRLDANP